MMGKETSTGRKSVGAATGEFFKRRDEWRKHPMLSNQFRHALPGFGIGLTAFGVYLLADFAYNKFYSAAPSHHHHNSSSAAPH